MKKIIFLTILVLVFIIACAPKAQRQIFEFDVHTGQDGIVFTFMEEAPPETVYEGTSLPIYLEFQNKGAHETTLDYILTVEERYLSLEEKRGTFRLEGKSVYDPKGQKEFMQHDADVLTLGKAQQTHETFVSATICYPYQTIATATVCVDTDPLSTTKRKVCDHKKEIALPGGQGGPVGITKVKPQMIPLKDTGTVNPNFEITINNFKKGSILNKARTSDACRLMRASAEDLYNLIRIRAFLSDQELMCRPSETTGRGATLKWSSKNNKIRCSLPEGVKNLGNYPAPLRITLDYGYTETLTEKVLIKKT